MPQSDRDRPTPRDDGPGVWHHVMNRGLARRPAFEGRGDIRFFLSRLARKIRKGQIEVHAYSILMTHFHLLVRSPRGELSDAMMWIENQYVRRFNRRRDRDGSLFRGRFTSRVVDSIAYWHTLVRYIDENAVLAGLAGSPEEYRYGSAWHYARASGPIWLSREIIESEISPRASLGPYDPAGYRRTFGSPLGEDGRWIVDRRTSRGSRFHEADDALDDLVSALPERVHARMKERARLADQVDLGAPVAAPNALLLEIERERSSRPVWVMTTSTGRSVLAWQVLTTGLLRSACALTIRETAHRLGIGAAKVARAERLHAEWLERSAEYSGIAARLLATSIERTIGPRVSMGSTSRIDLRHL